MKRRDFLRRAGLAAGGMIAVPFIAPRALAGSSTIVDVSGDKRIELSNASFARPFNVGTWSKIRLCLRLNFVASANVTGTPRLVFGFASGNAAQVFDGTTTNFIGIRTGAASITYNNDTIDYLSNTSGAIWNRTKRVGATWTDTANNRNFICSCENAASQMMFVEIATGSPNYTLNFFIPGTPIADVSRADFLAQAIAASPSYGGHDWDTSSIAFDEVAGALDNICVGWSDFTATLRITDIAVVKFA